MSKKKPGFAVEVAQRRDGIAVLSLVGNSEKHDEARDLVDAAMVKVLAAGQHRILVDATRLDWMTADVIGALIGDFQRLREAGGWIVFAGLNDEVGPFLQELGVLEFIGNTETVEEGAEWLLENVTETTPISDKRLKVTGQEHPGGALVLGLVGSMGERQAEKFTEVVEGKIAKGASKLVIDCRKLLDAAGIAHFLLLVERAKKLGAKVSFATIWGVPGAVVETLGLGGVRDIHADVDAAVAALQERPKRRK